MSLTLSEFLVRRPEFTEVDPPLVEPTGHGVARIVLLSNDGILPEGLVRFSGGVRVLGPKDRFMRRRANLKRAVVRDAVFDFADGWVAREINKLRTFDPKAAFTPRDYRDPKTNFALECAKGDLEVNGGRLLVRALNASGWSIDSRGSYAKARVVNVFLKRGISKEVAVPLLSGWVREKWLDMHPEPEGFAAQEKERAANTRVVTSGISFPDVPRSWEQARPAMPRGWDEDGLMTLFTMQYAVDYSGGRFLEHTPGSVVEEPTATWLDKFYVRVPFADPWRKALLSFVQGRPHVLNEELEQHVAGRKATPSELSRIHAIMTRAKWKKATIRNGQHEKRVWRPIAGAALPGETLEAT